MLTKRLIVAAISGLMFVAGVAQAGGDAARGKELSIDCADCHGEDGKGDDETPAIAGLDEAYGYEQLKAFQSGERTDEEEVMLMYTEELSDQDLKDLAAYYSSLPGE